MSAADSRVNSSPPGASDTRVAGCAPTRTEDFAAGRVVSIDTDVLYPPGEQRELAALLPNAELVTLHSPHGHDAFLIEVARLDAIVRSFRRRVASRTAVRQGRGGAA